MEKMDLSSVLDFTAQKKERKNERNWDWEELQVCGTFKAGQVR